MLGGILAAIFGLVFAMGGVFIANETAIPTFQSWQSMQTWQATQGELISLDSAPNDTRATYTYHVDGQTYQHDRVYVAPFTDNIGDYHQELYSRLYRLKAQSLPVTVWYAPQDPQQAVLDRDMRWGLFTLVSVFCSVFILAGVGIAYSSLFKRSKTDKTRPSLGQLRQEWNTQRKETGNKDSFFSYLAARQHATADQESKPDKPRQSSDAPWLGRKAWQQRKIRSNAKKMMIGTWAFTLFWFAVCLPALAGAFSEWQKGDYVVLLVLIFPLIGLVMLYMAIQKTREWLRFGVIELTMDPFPGAIGGNVGGYIEIQNLKQLQVDYQVELQCVYSYMSGSGKNRSRSENTKWAEAGTAQVAATGRGVRLTFRFDVPDDLPEADVEQRGNYHFWRLKLKAQLPGADLNRDYNIPVFYTGELSQTIHRDISAQAEQRRLEAASLAQSQIDRGELNNTTLANALRYRQSGSKSQFYFPMFRNKLLTLFSAFFAGGFGFAAYSVISNFDTGGLQMIMAVFSIPFWLVAVVTGIAAIYLPLNNLSVSIDKGKLATTRRLFFIPISIHRVSNSDIQKLSIKNSGSTGHGVDKVEHFKIFAHTQTGKRITLAESIDGQDMAKQLKAFIAAKLHISDDYSATSA